MKEIKRIYGPYTAKDGRQRIILYYKDNTRKTVSYPKYLMEEYMCRFLKEDETVHHKDENPLNNEIDNLYILNRSDHAYLHSLQHPAEVKIFICPLCGMVFEKSMSQVRHNNVNNKKKGPFCSKRCAGIYSTNIQYKSK